MRCHSSWGECLKEEGETFHLVLSDAQYAVLPEAPGVGTILYDDPPEVSIGDVTVTEATGTNVDAVFTLHLSAASGREVRVSYASADGSALAESDYTAASGTVVFPTSVVVVKELIVLLAIFLIGLGIALILLCIAGAIKPGQEGNCIDFVFNLLKANPIVGGLIALFFALTGINELAQEHNLNKHRKRS